MDDVLVDTIQSRELAAYLPSEEQLRQVKTLGEIVKECADKEVDIYVGGGYGMDGLYGSLTRDHGDIDLIVDDEGVQKLDAILTNIGFISDQENTYPHKNVYIPNTVNALAKTFKVEIGTKSQYEKFLEGSMALETALPKEDNAKLLGFSFKALTLEGQKVSATLQDKRAKDGNWGDYKHQEHFQKMLNAIS